MSYNFEEIAEAVENSHQISSELIWGLEEIFAETIDDDLKDKVVSLLRKSQAQLTYLNKVENWLYQAHMEEMIELQNKPAE